MRFFTSDTHFGSEIELKWDNRPFKSVSEYDEYQVNMWNLQATEEDKIYVCGDFCNFNSIEQNCWLEGLQQVKRIRAKVILIIGNNEERVIKAHFNSDFSKFKEFCIGLGFEDVVQELYLQFRGRKFYLNHFPRNHKEGYDNLFGHGHRLIGLWRPYGLNVDTGLNHFKLYSEDDILDLLEQKEQFWDNDPDLNCM